MRLLQVENLSKSFGEEKVLEGVSLEINAQEKWGLVGPNGAGKTTLLKIITGEEEADQGSFSFSRGASKGYLQQKPRLAPGISLYRYLKKSLGSLYLVKEELSRLEREMSSYPAKGDPHHLENLVVRYGQLSHQFEEKGGYHLESRIRQVALGLGFKEEDLDRPAESFSGGEKTCMQIACLLLEDHDLLLLDEPTNYLDSGSVEWLEGYLNAWKGSLLVISHDRYFLDRVVNRVACLENHRLQGFRGNYSSFRQQYQEARQGQEKAFQRQVDEIKKEEVLIRNSKGGERDKRQARSREKRLEKLVRVEKPRQQETIKLGFNYAGRAGQEVVTVENLSKEFGGKVVIREADFVIKWGDRAALVGPNGSGKSTLLKMITGEIGPSRGKVCQGPSVRAIYFDQEQAQLDPESSPLDTIISISQFNLPEARTYLGRFLFRGDEVFKKIKNLSGGEKSRLVLARISLSPGNFLIMDEPTNHLDINGIAGLESTLQEYPGTLLMVSHDRYFISRLANKILELKEGRVRLYPGSYAYYQEVKEREKGESLPQGRELKKAHRRQQREQEKKDRAGILAWRKQERKLENNIKETEEKIARLEGTVALLEKKLACPEIYEDFNQVRRLNQEYQEARECLDFLYDRWEKACLSREKMNHNTT